MFAHPSMMIVRLRGRDGKVRYLSAQQPQLQNQTKRDAQRIHPRSPEISGHDIPGSRPESAQHQVQNLAEAYDLPSACRELPHPNQRA